MPSGIAQGSRAQPNGKIVKNALVLLFALVVAGGILLYLHQSFESTQEAAEWMRELGWIGPAAVIFLIALEVVAAPIPGGIIAVAAGFAFGAIKGTLYSYLGNLLGTAIAFSLARRFGRPLTEHLIDPEKLDLYDCFFREKGKIVLWLAFIFPVFPTDIICFVTGLSAINWKVFMAIAAIGYLPNMILLNYFGDTLRETGFGGPALYVGAFLLFVFLAGGLFYLHIRRETDRKCA